MLPLKSEFSNNQLLIFSENFSFVEVFISFIDKESLLGITSFELSVTFILRFTFFLVP